MFKKILNYFLPHYHEKGQGLIEYALILVLVAVVVIAILLVLGPTVGNVFSNIVANLQRVGIAGPSNSITLSASTFTVGGARRVTVTVSQATSVSVSVTSGGGGASLMTAPCGTTCTYNIPTWSSPGSATASGAGANSQTVTW